MKIPLIHLDHKLILLYPSLIWSIHDSTPSYLRYSYKQMNMDEISYQGEELGVRAGVPAPHLAPLALYLLLYLLNPMSITSMAMFGSFPSW
jgi:hypothetical protein